MTITSATGKLVDVPVDTFRSHISFVVTHDLWDDLDEALRQAGIDAITMDPRPVFVISELVANKGSQLSEDPRHAGAVVMTPECGCNGVITRPPNTPPQPGPPPGGQDGGHPPTTNAPVDGGGDGGGGTGDSGPD
jgi:hypothetical protein